MRKQLRKLGAIAVAGTVGGLSACGIVPSETVEDSAVLTEEITSVRVDNGAGAVTVRGSEGATDVSVHRKVEYRGDEPGSTFEVQEGVLVLGGCPRNCWVNYTVDLPAGIPVSGQVSSGTVTLSLVGDVDVSTRSGRIELDSVAGTVKVKTSSGRIEGRGLSGTSVEAESSNGDIELVAAAPQDVLAKTSNGSITLSVPEGSYRVEAGTRNGSEDIAVTDDPAGEHRLDLSTSNGDITVYLA
ncbi:DUF4097 family beta strand repeat-containing protein [Streptomyces sodiiphilus]